MSQKKQHLQENNSNLKEPYIILSPVSLSHRAQNAQTNSFVINNVKRNSFKLVIDSKIKHSRSQFQCAKSYSPELSYQNQMQKKVKSNLKKYEDFLAAITTKQFHSPQNSFYDSSSKKSPPKFISLCNLKKLIPNMDKEAPTSRQEAISLLEWYQQQHLGFGSSNYKHFHDIIEQAQQELARQLKYDCSQRGQVFQMICQDLMSIKSFEVSDLKLSYQKQENEKQREFSYLKSDYEKMFEKKIDDLKKAAEKEKDFDDRLEIIKKNELYQQKFQQEQKQVIVKLRNCLVYLERKLGQLTQQNAHLSAKLKQSEQPQHNYSSSSDTESNNLSHKMQDFQHTINTDKAETFKGLAQLDLNLCKISFTKQDKGIQTIISFADDYKNNQLEELKQKLIAEN